MAKLIKARSAQTVLEVEFKFNFDDTMVNTAGNEVDFGKVNAGGAAGIFEVAPLPVGAVVVGGSVDRSVAFDTAGYDVLVGDADVADRYLTSTDLKAVGSQALVPTGFISTGKPIRFKFSSDDVCTTGVCTVRVQYVIENRVSEVYL